MGHHIDPYRSVFGQVIGSQLMGSHDPESSVNSAPYMPVVMCSYSQAYKGAGGAADLDVDCARWDALFPDANQNLLSNSMHGSVENAMLLLYNVWYFNITTPAWVVPGDPHYVAYPSADLYIQSSTSYYENYVHVADFPTLAGAGTDPVLDYYLSAHFNSTSVTFFTRYSKPRHVRFYIQDDTEISRAQYNPGLDDYQDWLDKYEISWDETTVSQPRWLAWLCDFFEDHNNAT